MLWESHIAYQVPGRVTQALTSIDALQISFSVPGNQLGRGANSRILEHTNAFWANAVFKEGVTYDLEREDEKLWKLRHPHIVSLYGKVAVDDGQDRRN